MPFRSGINGHSFRVGDWVEVRPFEEVFATLDGEGCLDGLPFMPEMVQYCGSRFRVTKSAHKTCDPSGATNMRRMADAVHLNTRCDGKGHDGCEAQCLLFWKTAWLKPIENPGAAHRRDSAQAHVAKLNVLRSATRRISEEGNVAYRCQATEVVRATTNLPSRNIGQYFEDITTGNVSLPRFARYFGIAVLKALLSRAANLSGLRPNSSGLRPDSPPKLAQAAIGQEQPLALKPGDLVRIRSAREIASTLDKNGKNRGLTFEPEMMRYCGRSARVLCRVTQIIDERTGKKRKLGNDCIILEGLACEGLENRGRLFCPRSPYYLWREAWLQAAGGEHSTPIASGALFTRPRAQPSPNLPARSIET